MRTDSSWYRAVWEAAHGPKSGQYRESQRVRGPRPEPAPSVPRAVPRTGTDSAGGSR